MKMGRIFSIVLILLSVAKIQAQIGEWSSVSSGVINDLNAIEFVSLQKGFAVGDWKNRASWFFVTFGDKYLTFQC